MCILSYCFALLFQIHSAGGPSQANVVYSVNDSSVSRVDENGLVHAVAVGDALVTGEAEAEDSMKGRTVVYSVVRDCMCNMCVCVCV